MEKVEAGATLPHAVKVFYSFETDRTLQQTLLNLFEQNISLIFRQLRLGAI